jgi:hypothetical protein
MRPVWFAASWIGVCLALIYLPDCGVGFIKDDYGWIASSRLDGWHSVWQTFATSPTGFYRPLVSLSFGLNTIAFGLHPLPYGLTNLLLTVVTGVAIGSLVRRIGFQPGIALFAASVWMLNFHGIGVAVLWTSGRTSLLATFFAVCAAGAFISARPVACGIFTLLALLSKEEPLLLPAVFLLWLMIDAADAGTPVRKRRTWAVVASTVAVALYLAIRWRSGAMTPFTVPDFYQYQPSVIPINSLHYADRSLTLTISLLILGALFAWRERLHLTPHERSVILNGFVWLACGFALTVMIPVRSSLYVCLPSVGSALILAAIASAEWRAITRRRFVLTGLLMLPLVLVPVYWARDAQLSREQRLGRNVLRVVTSRLTGRQVRRLVVYDDPSHRPSIGDTFGEALPTALNLFLPENAPSEVVVSTEPPPSSAPGSDTVEFVLSGTTLIERRVP